MLHSRRRSASLPRMFRDDDTSDSHDEEELLIPITKPTMPKKELHIPPIPKPRRKMTHNLSNSNKIIKFVSFAPPLKISDEKKIDLRSESAERSEDANPDTSDYDDDLPNDDQPLLSLYPIEEFNEDTSRASSKMGLLREKHQDVMQSFFNSRKNNLRTEGTARPISRRSHQRPCEDNNVLLIHQSSNTSNTSVESFIHSEVGDFVRDPSRESSRMFDLRSSKSTSKKSVAIAHRIYSEESIDLSRKASTSRITYKEKSPPKTYSKKNALTANEMAELHAKANFVTMSSLPRSHMDLKIVESTRSLALSNSASSCLWKCFCPKTNSKKKS